MNLKQVGSNMTELNLGALTVLFSYSTPVAVMDYTKGSGWIGYYQTDKKWSQTTTRHINKWFHGIKTEIKPQEYFDNLIKEVA